jgi:hypothetical protein
MPPPASLTCMESDCSAGGGVSLTPPPPPPPVCCGFALRSSEGVRSRPPPPTGWLGGLSEEAVRGVTCPESTFTSFLHIMSGLTWASVAGKQTLRLRCLGSRALHQHISSLHRVVCRVQHARARITRAHLAARRGVCRNWLPAGHVGGARQEASHLHRPLQCSTLVWKW